MLQYIMAMKDTSSSGRSTAALTLSVFALLSVTLYAGFIYALWTRNSTLEKQNSMLTTQTANLEKQNAILTTQTANLEKQNAIFEERLQIIEAREFQPDSSEPVTVVNALKRMTKRQADDSTQSATDLLTEALNELIEKKLYTILECSADNVTDCSLKPGPKGDKGNTGDQGKDGPQGLPGNPGVKGDKGHYGYPGYPGHKGEVGPAGDPGVPGRRGVKGDMGAIGPTGRQGVKGEHGEKGIKGQQGYPGFKGRNGSPGVKGERGYKGQKGEKGMIGEPGPQVEWPSATCGGAGWRRVTFLDMTNTTHNCPNGLQLTNYSKRSCGRVHRKRESCSSSIFFPVGGRQYSQVCGRAKAYQRGYMHSFNGYNRDGYTIDEQYLSGLSFTHGTNRTHIWSFAAGLHSGRIGKNAGFMYYRCPCNPGNTYGSPPFVGNDYFCESGVTVLVPFTAGRTFYPDDPLWDGRGCIRGNTCCQHNNPPWFYKTLPKPTTDDIEMRMCIQTLGSFSDIALEQVEIYVS